MLSQQVRLRNIEQSDLPRMYEMQIDAESNQLAMTIPRSADEFFKHWAVVLDNQKIIAKAIYVDVTLAGCISCFQVNDVDCVGYWIDKQFWNRGVATQALRLLLLEIETRPLHARVATTNTASLRVLEKCGFEIIDKRFSAADDRHLACQESLLVLR